MERGLPQADESEINSVILWLNHERKCLQSSQHVRTDKSHCSWDDKLCCLL